MTDQATITVRPTFWLRERPSSTGRATRTPLVIYVLWHPSFAEGPVLGREIADWCGGSVSDIRAAGMGIPVFFRSEPWTAELALEDREAPPQPAAPGTPDAVREQALEVWRRPIELDDCVHNVFVPLVDDHMVDDPSWRRDLLDLAARHRAKAEPRVHLAPIQISSAWTRLPVMVSGIQALFIRRWNDPEPTTDEEKAKRLATWRTRIRRLLTQSLVRLLRSVHEELGVEGRSSLPTEVFLSHAKADRELGPGVAERLRDTAAGYGQVEVFYDENDLPAGGDWSRQLSIAAREGAGFVSVLGDAYASRYWCRREVQLARTPIPAASVDLEARPYTWRVRPTVVTVTMQGKWSRLLGDVSAVPAIRWNDKEDHPTAILDQVFREALITEFQVQYANLIHRRLAPIASGEALPLAYITWTLDPTTLMRLYGQIRQRMGDGGLIIYPGNGFLPTEEAELTASLGEQTRFVPFERFSDLVDARPPDWQTLVASTANTDPSIPMARRPLVALSAGDSDDLGRLGYDAPPAGSPEGGSIHVDAAVLRLCRTLLQGQARLAYGGILRAGPSFTSLLHDIVIGMANSDLQPPAPEPDPLTPLENWVAKPYAHAHPASLRASLVGLCRWYFVGDALPKDAQPHEAARVTSEALSLMRHLVAERSSMTLALAGKRYGFDGMLPGVAEEILCSWEHNRQVCVLMMGEYGGIVREVVRYILRRTDTLPAPLTFEGQLDNKHSKFETLMSSDEVRQRAAARYAELARCLNELRAIADQDPATELPRLGITVEQWRHVMSTQSVGFVRRLLRDRVLPTLRGDG